MTTNPSFQRVQLEEHSRPTTHSSYVLLAEDDPDLRGLFATGLHRRGYEVTSLCDGREMLAAFTAICHRQIRMPDAIVMDIRIPGFSGLDLLRALKRAEWEAPVILMTGFGDAQTHALARELGAFELLDKPVSIVRLVTSLEAAASSPSSRKRQEP